VNPIVPRDQVTSKSIVTSESFSRLPIQDTRDVIRLEPGVVESNSGKGLSIRGGRPGEARCMSTACWCGTASAARRT